MAALAPPQPISLGPDRWALTPDALIISRGIGPWRKRRAVPVATIQAVEYAAADVTGAPRWVATGDPGPEAALRGRLRAAALGGAAPEARTLLLLSLLHACHLADGLFADEERGEARRRVEELAAGERAGRAVGQALAEVVAAATSTVAVAPGAHH